MTSEQYLERYFGFKEFRGSQKAVIETLLSGRDTLVVMPTGAGKSVCYQLPAVIKPGLALVVSPLISLMKDQTDYLNRIGIPADYINSSLKQSEIIDRLDRARSGRMKLLYSAPERFESASFCNELSGLNLSFLAVDEAHCISEWGNDFRPAYKSIISLFEKIKRIPIIALTATATPEVRDDICGSLNLHKPAKYVGGFDRPNLAFNVVELPPEKRIDEISKILRKTKKGSSIVYCPSRRLVDEITDKLKKSGIYASAYHAGYPDNYRRSIQERFSDDKIKIIVATNAFGMGIDKADVRNVIHAGVCSSIESYYQEAGRAGRDGLDSVCTLFYDQSDRKLQEYFISTSNPDSSDILAVYNHIYDSMQCGVGTKPTEPLLSDNFRIGNALALPAVKVTAIMNYLEKRGVIRKALSKGISSVEFTVSRERIEEFYETATEKNRSVISALMRTVGTTAFDRCVEFEPHEMIKKHALQSEDFSESMRSLASLKLLVYRSPDMPYGYYFRSARLPEESLRFEHAESAKRRNFAIKKLDAVFGYCETRQCKRNFILTYFGSDEFDGDCGRCSSCESPGRKAVKMRPDKTELRMKCIKSVAALNGKFGMKTVADFIKGIKSEKILKFGLDKSECFASARSETIDKIKETLKELTKDGIILVSGDLLPVVFLSEKGQTAVPDDLPRFDFSDSGTSAGKDLYALLHDLRARKAVEERIEPRAVLGDAALRKMADTMPRSLREIKNAGFSPLFAERFGEDFARLIARYSADDDSSAASRSSITPSAQKSIEYLSGGATIEETAKRFGIKPLTVAKHLEEAVKCGVITIDAVPAEEGLLESIRPILKSAPGKTLADLKTSFPSAELWKIKLSMIKIQGEIRNDNQ